MIKIVCSSDVIFYYLGLRQFKEMSLYPPEQQVAVSRRHNVAIDPKTR